MAWENRIDVGKEAKSTSLHIVTAKAEIVEKLANLVK